MEKKPISVTILRNEDRCYLTTSGFSRSLVDRIKQINKRFYNSEKKEWVFSSEYLDDLLDDLDFIGVSYKLASKKPVAFCKKVGDTYQVRLSTLVKGLSISEIENAYYDRTESKFFIPVNKKEEMFKILCER